MVQKLKVRTEEVGYYSSSLHPSDFPETAISHKATLAISCSGGKRDNQGLVLL